MNWYFVLELLAHIAVCQVIYLPLTVYLWREREAESCNGFKMKDVPALAIHVQDTMAG
jgi:hypothetical protein